MELKGKKIYFLGDSITEGVGVSDRENDAYVSVFAKNTGAVVHNFGVNGTRIAIYKGENDDYPEYFRLRAQRIPQDADVIVIFGGTNDYGIGDALIGTMEDRTVDTFYGALHDLYSLLISNHPTAAILVVTPLHRENETLPGGEGSQRDKANLEVYVNVIRRVAEYYSLPVLDLFKESGIQPAIPVIKELYLPDGLHPNELGCKKLAKLIENKLRIM